MVVAVTGAAGFVGRQVCWRLLEKGEGVRGLVRTREQEEAVQAVGAGTVPGDVARPETLHDLVRGANAVVHLVAILRERPGSTFDSVNYEGTLNVLEACRKAGVSRIVHLSALGATPGPSYPYAHSKWRAEEAVRASGTEHTILRPSLLFGRGHPVFAALARQIRGRRIVPVPGDGSVRLQPMYVGDLSECVRLAVRDSKLAGRTLDLGGPQQLTYDEILDLLMDRLGRRPIKAHVPGRVALLGASILEFSSRNPEVTRAEIAQLLREDNVCATDSIEREFGFQPRTLREGLEEMF